jgi:hypothetical protein
MQDFIAMIGKQAEVWGSARIRGNHRGRDGQRSTAPLATRATGGMTMVGEMFNHALTTRVDGLCPEAAGMLGNAWFREGCVKAIGQGTGNFQDTGCPSALGIPGSSVPQNSVRYAFFTATHR